jgi:hypothetical protein
VKKARVRVGGGCRGRLIYYGYTVYGDKWRWMTELEGYGYRFLPRRDKTGLTPYLHGLKSALKKIIDEADDQYELVYYCPNRRLYELLSSWGNGYRDKMIVDLVNEVKRLSNSIGYMRIVKSKITSIEKRIRRDAEGKFNKAVEEVFKESRSWITSEDGYIVYILDESSKHIPLEYLSSIAIHRENGAKGVILLRSSGIVTRLLHHSIEGSREILDRLRRMDLGFVGEWRGTYRSLYVTRSSIDDLEELLLEVAS